jgi:hypothetical protein
MKDQGTSGFGKRKQIAAKLIMQAGQLADGIGREALKESAQGRFVGELFQTQKGQEEAIVLKLVRLADALDSSDQDKEQQHDQVDRIKLRPVRSGSQKALEPTAKTDFVTKSLNEEQSTVMRQAIRFEGKRQ